MAGDVMHSGVLEVSVDGSGVASGIAEPIAAVNRFEEAVTRAAKKSAAELDKVEQAGKKTGRNLANLGDGVDASAKKVERATASMQGQLQRLNIELASGGKNTRAFFEATAASKGVDVNALKPMLEQLDSLKMKQDLAAKAMLATQPAMQQMGMSAKQTAFALRGIPAQFTDIAVSLQGGQAPLTVFLQQGGQLKDMFGGIGPAAKAMGGYILGMINPFTIAAAAVAVLAYAYKKGSEENDAYNKALILTGNIAGTTAGQLQGMASNISKSVGTQGAAAAALAEMAGTGRIAAASLEKFARVAVQMEKTVGQSVANTAKDLAELGKSPVEASEKLNEKYHYLTASVYEQIKALHEQGRSHEAAAVAQNTYADAFDGITGKMEANLGSIERGWRDVASAVKEALDGMLNVGRSDTTVGKLAKVSSEIEDAQKRLKRFGASGGGLVDQLFANSAKEGLARLFDQQGILQENLRLESDAAAMAAEHAKQNEAAIKWIDDGNKYLSKQKQMEIEIAKARTEGAAARAPQKDINDRVKAIESKYEDKGAAAAIKKEASAYASLVASIGEKIAAGKLEMSGYDKLSESQKLTIKLDESIAAGKSVLTPKHIANAKAMIEERVAIESVIESNKRELDHRKESIKAYADTIEGHQKLANSLRQQVRMQLEHNDAIGLGKDAIANLEAARLSEDAASKDRLATLADEIDWSGKLGDAHREQAAALRELAIAKSSGGAKQVSVDAGKKAAEELDKFLDPAKAQEFGDALKDAFNGAGSALQQLSLSLQSYGQKQASISKQRANADEAKRTGQISEKEYIKSIAALNDQDAKNKAGGYGDIANAAKSFFDESSSGYKTLDGVAKAFHAAQLAMNIVQSGQLAVKAVLTQAQGEPYTAWARMAAMAAAVGALGYAVGGGFNSSSGDATSAADRQKVQGAGAVLGDSSEKSGSLLGALEALDDNTFSQLRYSSAMLDALKNIEKSMTGLAQILFRTDGITSGNNLGIFEGELAVSGMTKLPLISGITKALNKMIFGSTTQSITDSGLSAGGTLSDLINGRGVRQYVDVETTKKRLFGLIKKTSYDTQYAELDQGVAKQFGLVFKGISDSLQVAAVSFGIDADAVAAELAGYVVDIPKISLRGLKGDDLQDALNAVFSGAADNMSRTLMPGFENLQKVGEGYYETLIRVSDTLVTTNSWMSMLRQRLFQVSMAGAQAAAQLADAFDGLNNLNEATQAFYETYYSESERAERTLQDMAAALVTVNVSMPDTMAELRSMALALDLNTEAGRAAYVMLLKIAPEFANTAEAIKRLAQEAAESLMQAFTGRGQLMPALDATALKTMLLKNTLVSTYTAAGNISTLFLDVQSGLITFGSSAAALDASMTGAQQASMLLNSQINNLRLGADGATIDIAGLTAALAGVNAETFVSTLALVFENLAQRIGAVIDDIAGERIAVREAALQVINPTVMSKAAIQYQIGSINTALPSNSGVVTASVPLAAADARVATDNARIEAQRSTLGQYQESLAGANSAVNSQASVISALTAQIGTLDAERFNISETSRILGTIAMGYDEMAGRVTDLNEFYNANGGPALESNIATLNQQIAAINALMPQSNEYIQNWTNSVAAQGLVVAASEADLIQSRAIQAAAIEQIKTAQLAYAAALQTFAIDAGKSVSKLSKLREETVKYYDAQKQLADLMGNSAAGLRKTAGDYRVGQLSTEDQFKELSGQFASTYSMGLSTDGAALAGYGDKLNAMISPLLTLARDTMGSDTAYASFAAGTLARADSIASKLEALKPTDYAADSLFMLSQIDATLAALDASSRSAEKIISDAINAGSDKTASGLRAVIAALTGTSVPAFAAGGNHLGGLRIVGENGPELEATGPSRIFNASQTRSMMDRTTARLEALVERQTQELSNLQATNREMAQDMRKLKDIMVNVTQGGEKMLTEAA